MRNRYKDGMQTVVVGCDGDERVYIREGWSITEMLLWHFVQHITDERVVEL